MQRFTRSADRAHARLFEVQVRVEWHPDLAPVFGDDLSDLVHKAVAALVRAPVPFVSYDDVAFLYRDQWIEIWCDPKVDGVLTVALDFSRDGVAKRAIRINSEMEEEDRLHRERGRRKTTLM